MRERRALSGSEPTGWEKPARPAGTRSSSIRAQAWHVPLSLAQHTTALPSVANSTGALAFACAAGAEACQHASARPPPAAASASAERAATSCSYAPPFAGGFAICLAGCSDHNLAADVLQHRHAAPLHMQTRERPVRQQLRNVRSAARSQRATKYSRRCAARCCSARRPASAYRIAWRRHVLCRTVWQRRRRLSRTSTAPCLRWPL